MNAFLRE